MRQVDPKYLDMVRELPCCSCGRFPTKDVPNHPAHIRFADAAANKPITGGGIRPDDKWVLPLCPKCHTNGKEAQHNSRTHERLWWEDQGVNAIERCQTLYKCWEDGRRQRLSWPLRRDMMIEIIGLGWLHG